MLFILITVLFNNLFAQSDDYIRGFKDGYKEGERKCTSLAEVQFCVLKWRGTWQDKMAPIAGWGGTQNDAKLTIMNQCSNETSTDNIAKCKSIAMTDSKCYAVSTLNEKFVCSLSWRSAFGDSMPSFTGAGESKEKALRAIDKQCLSQPSTGNIGECRSALAVDSKCSKL